MTSARPVDDKAEGAESGRQLIVAREAARMLCRSELSDSIGEIWFVYVRDGARSKIFALSAMYESVARNHIGMGERVPSNNWTRSARLD